MINGISIPVMTPFKFHPYNETTGDGVNFQNTDNTEQHLQDWEGVYPYRWVQPVVKYWYDYSPGIDFMIKIDTGTILLAHATARLVDLEGALVKTLDKTSWFTSGADTWIRFYLNDLTFDNGCYRIELQDNGVTVYESEVINVQETIEDCYPFEYSNFENDFGVIFDNSSAEWTGKLMIPMRIFEPVTEDERETYENDGGGLVTLRAVPKRMVRFESENVPTWFAEKVKIAFSCSELKVNKLDVNSENSPEISLISQSDNMEIQGVIQLTDFSTDYFYEEKIDDTTELATSWTDTSSNWDTFTATVNNLVAKTGVLDAGEGETNSISVTKDVNYLINVTVEEGASIEDTFISYDGNNISLKVGDNVYLYVPATTKSIKFELESDPGDFDLTASMKNIT